MPFKDPDKARASARSRKRRQRASYKASHPPRPVGRPAKADTVRSVPYQQEDLVDFQEHAPAVQDSANNNSSSVPSAYAKRMQRQRAEWQRLFELRSWDPPPRFASIVYPREPDGFGNRHAEVLRSRVEVRGLDALLELPTFVGDSSEEPADDVDRLIALHARVRISERELARKYGLPGDCGVFFLDYIDKFKRDDPGFVRFLHSMTPDESEPVLVPEPVQRSFPWRNSNRCVIHDGLLSLFGSKGQEYARPICYRCLE